MYGTRADGRYKRPQKILGFKPAKVSLRASHNHPREATKASGQRVYDINPINYSEHTTKNSVKAQGGKSPPSLC